jgi:hypothetical protein
MKAAEREALWQRLAAASLAAGDMPPPGDQPPWYVRAMLGAAGWLAALFALGFAGVALPALWREHTLAIVVGLATCAAALAIVRMREGDLSAQFSFAVSVAGQALCYSGLAGLLGARGVATPTVFLLLQAALIAGAPNFLHRFSSTLVAVVALGAALSALRLTFLLPPLLAAGFACVWLAEERWGRQRALFQPVGWGLAVALALAGLLQVAHHSRWSTELFPPVDPRLGPALVGVVLVAVIAALLRRAELAPASRTGLAALAAGAAIALCGVWAPGVAAALIVILVGRQVVNPKLIALGIVALLGYLGWYYYSLSVTLLLKSLALAASGAVMLALRTLLRRFGDGDA